MSGTGDRRVWAIVSRELQEGPRDVLDLAASLREELGDVFARKEGQLHAFLHGRLRRGLLHVVGRSARDLAAYALADEEADASAPEDVVPDRPASGDLTRAAARIAAAVRDESERSRVLSDVLAHLAALERSGGTSSFGSQRTARHFLRRADRGRPTVYFIGSAGDGWKRFLYHETPWIVIAIIAFLVLRAWVVEVFVIPSSSMVPTLQIDDRVVVFKPGGRGVPDRFRIVTYERSDITYVKRVAGRGGEAIELLGGDVYVNGELAVKPDRIRRALRFPYRAWEFGDAVPEEWSEAAAGDDRVLRYDGAPLWSGGDARGGGGGRDVALRDVYLELAADRPSGASVALELAITAPVEAGEEDVAYELEVSDRGVVLWERPLGPGSTDARIEHVLGAGPGRGGSVDLHLSHVDGILRASAGGVSFTGAPALPPPVHGTARFTLRSRGEAAFRSLLLDKDIHYALMGNLAVAQPGTFDPPGTYAFEVPDGHVFLLGDNTYDSRDSRYRTVGPIPQGELVGPVVFRIWPLGRMGVVR
ncbi:MAG: signal peptidase I [Planctomycetota bacterium]|jgi:signal peptidase I